MRLLLAELDSPLSLSWGKNNSPILKQQCSAPNTRRRSAQLPGAQRRREERKQSMERTCTLALLHYPLSGTRCGLPCERRAPRASPIEPLSSPPQAPGRTPMPCLPFHPTSKALTGNLEPRKPSNEPLIVDSARRVNLSRTPLSWYTPAILQTDNLLLSGVTAPCTILQRRAHAPFQCPSSRPLAARATGL